MSGQKELLRLMVWRGLVLTLLDAPPPSGEQLIIEDLLGVANPRLNQIHPILIQGTHTIQVSASVQREINQTLNEKPSSYTNGRT